MYNFAFLPWSEKFLEMCTFIGVHCVRVCVCVRVFCARASVCVYVCVYMCVGVFVTQTETHKLATNYRVW